MFCVNYNGVSVTNGRTSPLFMSWMLCSDSSCLFGEILKGVFLGSSHLGPDSNKGELQGYHFISHQQSHGCLNLHFTSQLQLLNSSITPLVVNKQPLPVYRTSFKRLSSCYLSRGHIQYIPYIC